MLLPRGTAGGGTDATFWLQRCSQRPGQQHPLLVEKRPPSHTAAPFPWRGREQTCSWGQAAPQPAKTAKKLQHGVPLPWPRHRSGEHARSRGSGPLGSLQLQAVQQGFNVRQCTAKPNERSCFESTKCPYSSQNGNFVRCPQASQGKHKPHACRGTGAQTLLLLM